MQYTFLKLRWLALVAVLLGSFACSQQKKDFTSPNGRLRLTYKASSDSLISYSLYYDNKPIVVDGALGFETIAQDLKHFSIMGETSVREHDEEYTMPWGEWTRYRDHYNEISLPLKACSGKMEVLFRLYDEGMALRYRYEGNTPDSVMIMQELTSFPLVGTERSFSIPANTSTYELEYRELPLTEIGEEVGAATPITIESKEGGPWLAIHEAELIDFPEITLVKRAHHGDTVTLKAQYTSAWPDGVMSRQGSSFQSPWRSIALADSAVGLVKSSALWQHLNEPSKIEDTSWIKPIKYVGVWWGMHLGINSWKEDERHGATTSEAIRYIDFAHKEGVDAVLFEGWNTGWDGWGDEQRFGYATSAKDFDLDSVLSYAQAKGVAFIIHHETGANMADYERQIDSVFAWCREKGIHYLKTGYAGGIPGGYHRHSQYAVRHYRKVVELAAKYQIMIDAHEPIKDTGARRTYPNMMTREGARGMEWNAWSRGNSPEHEVMLPFTRLLSGPMDYTPGVFDVTYKNIDPKKRIKWNDLDEGNSRVNTTLSRQVADWIVLYSPWQMASDLLENYEGEEAFELFRRLSLDLEETYPLDGYPGKFYIVARKAKGEQFMLGAIAALEGYKGKVALSFLPNNIRYRMLRVQDTPEANWESNPTAYSVDSMEVDSKTILNLNIAPAGGTAVIFEPLD